MAMVSLTEKEREICRGIVVKGLDYLKDLGFNSEQRKEFLSRKKIIRELDRQSVLFNDRGGIAERQRFFSLLEMSKFVPAAINIVVSTLRGTYQKETGKVVGGEKEMEIVLPPSQAQLAAATEILDRLGITIKGIDDKSAPIIDSRMIQVNAGDGSLSQSSPDLDSAVSRERVRTFIEGVLTDVGRVSRYRLDPNTKEIIDTVKEHGGGKIKRKAPRRLNPPE